jgi:hypothetical protein
MTLVAFVRGVLTVGQLTSFCMYAEKLGGSLEELSEAAAGATKAQVRVDVHATNNGAARSECKCTFLILLRALGVGFSTYCSKPTSHVKRQTRGQPPG